MRTLCLATLLLTACSYTFDGDEPDFPLVGSPPLKNSLKKLNRAPASPFSLMYGVDNTYWAAFTETAPFNIADLLAGFQPKRLVRLVRLEEPMAEEVIEDVPEDTDFHFHSVFFFRKEGDGQYHLHTIRPGAGGKGVDFAFPTNSVLITSGADEVFVFWIRDPAISTFEIAWRDGSAGRVLPKFEVTNLSSSMFLFSSDLSTLVTRSDGNPKIVAHATRRQEDIELGYATQIYGFDESRKSLLVCGSAADPLGGDPAPPAFESVKLDGSGRTQLTSECPAGSFFVYRREAIYSTANEAVLRAVPLDGSAPSRVFFDTGRQLLAIGPKQEFIYSQDPVNKYIHNATDGWLGDWRFMERGRDVQFSVDGTRLYWLEHAAQGNASGQLTSASIPNGAPVRLQRNVEQFDKLADGRLLAVANHAFRGIHNRIVAVDEQAHVAQWVAESGSAYVFVPYADDLLVDVVTGPSTYDILRVPIPPKLQQ